MVRDVLEPDALRGARPVLRGPRGSDASWLPDQYDETYDHKITRPLNVDLFIEKTQDFHSAFERFASFLDDLKKYQELAIGRPASIQYVKSKEINKIVYTMQQSIGSIG